MTAVARATFRRFETATAPNPSHRGARPQDSGRTLRPCIGLHPAQDSAGQAGLFAPRNRCVPVSLPPSSVERTGLSVGAPRLAGPLGSLSARLEPPPQDSGGGPGIQPRPQDSGRRWAAYRQRRRIAPLPSGTLSLRSPLAALPVGSGGVPPPFPLQTFGHASSASPHFAADSGGQPAR